MKVLNVNAMLDTKVGGGTAERTFQLTRYLAGQGVVCTVLTLDTGLPAERIKALAPARIVALPKLWSRYQVPWPAFDQIRRLVAEVDIIHLMGHWSILNAYVYLVARSAGRPYVVCPAGCLPIVTRSGLLKRIYNLVFGYRIIQNASAWIAVTAGEFPAFREYGIDSKRITVIPNGVAADDFQVSSPLPGDPLLPEGAPYILFIGRLNPVKGPDLLLEAFGRIASEFPAWRLIYAGPDEGMQGALEQGATALGLRERVSFSGFLGGGLKTAAYMAARLVVVPSRSDAMSIVAVEAGICATPVLMTDQCGLNELRLVDEGLVVPATVDGLAAGLRLALADSDRLRAWGYAWQALVRERYLWSRNGAAFQTLLEKAVATPKG